jgi:hypothetical protein
MLVVRYGPSCSAHVCGDYETIERSRQLMNPVLAASYSRAMQAALSGGGYSGTRPVSAKVLAAPAAKGRSRKPLFDFTTDHLSDGAVPADFVDAVFQRIRRMRNEDWSGLFLWLLLVLVPSGIAIFFARDRYYRWRKENITLLLWDAKREPDRTKPKMRAG